MTEQAFQLDLRSIAQRINVVKNGGKLGLLRKGYNNCVWAAPQLAALVDALERDEAFFTGGMIDAVFLQYLKFYLFGVGQLGKSIDFRQVLTPLQHELRPDIVSFVLTKRCNFRCPHCYNDSGRPHAHELSHTEKVSIVDYLGRWGVPHLVLSGGEPTIDSSFAEILDVAKSYGMRLKLTTNGWEMPRSLLDAITAKVVVQVNVSVDGSGPESHDYYRGKSGSFDRLVSSIQEIQKAGLRKVVINSCIGAGRIDDMEAIVRFAVERNCDELSFKALLFAGRDDHVARARVLDSAELGKFHSERERLRYRFRDVISIEGNLITNEVPEELRNDVSCNAASLSMTIGSDGSLYPCEIISPFMTVQNARDIFPAQAWIEGNIFQEFRKHKAARSGGCGTAGCPGSALAGSKLTTISV